MSYKPRLSLPKCLHLLAERLEYGSQATIDAALHDYARRELLKIAFTTYKAKYPPLRIKKHSLPENEESSLP